MDLNRGQISGNCLGKEGKGEAYWKSSSAISSFHINGPISNLSAWKGNDCSLGDFQKY